MQARLDGPQPTLEYSSDLSFRKIFVEAQCDHAPLPEWQAAEDRPCFVYFGIVKTDPLMW
jgi:hypothetical protein